MNDEEKALILYEDGLPFIPEWHDPMREVPLDGSEVIITSGDKIIFRDGETRLPITTNVVFDGYVFRCKPFNFFGKRLGGYLVHEKKVGKWAYAKFI